VSLDRAHGVDALQRAPLRVLTDPEAVLPCAAGERRSSGNTRFEVDLERTRFHRGGWVSGALTVWPEKAVTTTGLRVRLVREVRQLQSTTEHARDVHSEIPITGAFDFIPGAPFRVPFQVAFPPEPSPCCTTPGSEQHWFLEIVIDVKWWPDEVIRVSLGVT
jgi:hypothetical protein